MMEGGKGPVRGVTVHGPCDDVGRHSLLSLLRNVFAVCRRPLAKDASLRS